MQSAAFDLLPRYRGTFARSSANQLSTTAIRGRDCSAGSFIMRNRSPSRDTLWLRGRVHPGLSGYGPANSALGGPLRPFSRSTLTAITLSPLRYTSSRPPRVHIGSDPLAGETFHRFTLGLGCDWAYTSTRPDSSES